MSINIRVANLTLLLLLSSSTAFAGTRMIFPRVVFRDGLYSGIAISNPNTSDATIKVTGYNLDGTKYSGTGVTNDVAFPIKAGGQFLALASQVFNPPASVLGSATPVYLWVDVTSDTTGLTGFYIEGDSSFTFQYGGDLGTFGTDLYLPAVENSGTTVTEISLVNPDTSATGTAANVTVDFLKADGTQASASKNLLVPRSGAIMGPLSGIPGFNIAYGQVVALRIHSDKPVLCYGVIRPSSGATPVALPAEDATTPAKTLYFPQLAQGQGWATSLGIANLNFSAQTLVNITAYKPDGTIYVDPNITNPASVPIPAGGYLHKSFTELFPFADTSYKEGWIKVEADAPAINGFVEYGSGDNRALVIAQLNSYQLSMFSHQAQAAPYFTGLAVLNPGTLAANVEIFSLDNKGSSWGKTQVVLKPGQRISQLLFQIVSASTDKTGGSVYVRSDRPVISTELFAKQDLTALANVPPQQVITTFNPSGAAKVAPVPALAVVETGKTQTFTAPGLSGVDWSVNGVKGGSSDLGTISGAGVYQAPGKVPAPRTLTIQATSGNSTGGSSIDVVQREQLTGGLTQVTSIAYVDNLKRFFVAEQQVLAGAPSVGFAAAAPTNIYKYEVVQGTQNKTTVQTIAGDTIAKMLPYKSGSNTYLLLAGKVTGKIYRMDANNNALATVISGLNQPNSMAIDPVTGNLLVAESGANQITVVSQSQILGASAPGVSRESSAGTGTIARITLAGIQGIAVDDCTGTVYATASDGSLHEYQGNSVRTVESDLDGPGQLLPLYRDGFSCRESLTLAVVEATRVRLFYPKVPSLPATTLLDTTSNPVSDLTFFPAGNPFTSGGEGSIGLAKPSSTAGAVDDVRVGGAYTSAPPVSLPFFGSLVTGPNEDPIGDTFDLGLASQFGYSIPDITSVTGSIQGGNFVITIKFADPVSLGSGQIGQNGLPVDGVWAFVFMKTTGLGSVPLFQGLDLSLYFPFADASLFTFDSWIGVFDALGEYVSINQQTGGNVEVSAVGNVLTLAVPASAFNLTTGASAIVIVGNPGEFTDVAPNSGILELIGPVH